MKLIKHMIFSDLGDGNRLLINALNGTMDEISQSVYATLSEWKDREQIIPQNADEKTLYDSLNSRGYLLTMMPPKQLKNKQYWMHCAKTITQTGTA